MDGDPVELGVALLGSLPGASISIAEAVDRLESITTDPRLTREILDTAVDRGIVDRDHDTINLKPRLRARPKRRVVRREGEFSCRRCNASLTTGYFVRFDAGELGPFGSSCIQKVTGRA